MNGKYPAPPKLPGKTGYRKIKEGSPGGAMFNQFAAGFTIGVIIGVLTMWIISILERV